MEFSQTKAAKLLWCGIVCFGFATAGILISKSYKDWQDSPISTSITTQPIEDLDFPIVTICPPKDSKAALYYDLAKAGNRTLSDKVRDQLKRHAIKIFMEHTHNNYAKKMLPSSYMGNMDQILQGFHSVPQLYSQNGVMTKMWNLNGTITTPWFGKDFVEDYYKEDKGFLMMLELPEDVKDLVGSGSLVIELNVDTNAQCSRWMLW